MIEHGLGLLLIVGAGVAVLLVHVVFPILFCVGLLSFLFRR